MGKHLLEGNSMTRVYMVEVKTYVAVVANNDIEAEKLVKDSLGEVVKDDPDIKCVNVGRITRLDQLPAYGWDASALPYGDNTVNGHSQNLREILT